MSDPVRDPLLAAVAIVRSDIQRQTGETSTRSSLEAGLLEISMSEDPMAVINALAMLTSTALSMNAALTAALGGKVLSAGELLEVIEKSIRGSRRRDR